MATEGGLVGVGLTLGYATSAGGALTTVAQVRDIRGPSGSRTPVRVSHQSSTGRAHEFKPGMIDWGFIDWEGNLVVGPTADATNHYDLINTVLVGTTIHYWRFTTAAAGGDYMEIQGFISDWNFMGIFDGNVNVEGRIKCSGPLTTTWA